MNPNLVRLTGLILLLSCTGATTETTPDAAELYAGLIEKHARELYAGDGLLPLFEAIGQRRFVLLGEASHGTREFYVWRDRITRHLVDEMDFDFVAVEGDWQAIRRLNEYVTLRRDHDNGVAGVMLETDRWPQWLWANREFAEFCEWLREHNAGLEADQRVGLYGLDLQNPDDSARAVLEWFEQHMPGKHERVEAAYRRFMALPEGFSAYASHLVQGGERLDDEAGLAVDLLNGLDYDNDEHWSAKQNGVAISQFEQYVHDSVWRGSSDGWNRRAEHFHRTMLRIAGRHDDRARGVAWAHNTHVGDARATAMHPQGQVNIGQLLRQSEGEEMVFIIGFSTYQGDVVAGPVGGSEGRVFELPEARSGSIEALLHEHGHDKTLLLFGDQMRQRENALVLGHRAIGVNYNPEREAYVPSLLPWRYDALIHIDRTSALTPLDP